MSLRDTEIELASGVYLDLASPRPVMTLGDVAHGLSHCCRFAGQARRFYSVAEHAVVVAERLRSQGAPDRVVLAGLHHDDSEAFIGDVTRPLKSLLPTYRDLEDALMAAIAEALRLPQIEVDERAMVKEADDWALSAEAFWLMPSRGAGWVCDGLYDPAQSARALPFGEVSGRARRAWLRWHTDVSRALV